MTTHSDTISQTSAAPRRGRSGYFRTEPAKDLRVPAAVERQLTFAPHGHVLTNTGVWSPDGAWIVYDVRSDAAGANFDGSRIERVHVETGEVEVLFTSARGAHCGVAACSPTDDRVALIHGPENPTSDWQYSAWHRRGVLVDARRPGVAETLDACDLVAPFTPGALRGGSHVHTFSGDGKWVAFTYEDHLLAQLDATSDDHDWNQRNVGVSVPARNVIVPTSHPRNHDGSHFTVLVTKTVNRPRPGSDEISRAFEDAWIGTNGYERADGSRQAKAIAFQGTVVTEQGTAIHEVFVVDLPEDLTQAGEGPLQGTATRRPLPPRGVVQRRLTFTAERRHPGLSGPRHWLRSSPDGSAIACLMADDAGIVQLWLISPSGGDPQQLTRQETSISSAFSWSFDGCWIAHTMDGSVCVTSAATGETRRLTERAAQPSVPRPEACVFSPDGSRIAFARETADEQGKLWNQIFVVDFGGGRASQ